MGPLTPLDQVASEVAQVLGSKQASLDVLVKVILDNRIVSYYLLLVSQGVDCTLTKLYYVWFNTGCKVEQLDSFI